MLMAGSSWAAFAAAALYKKNQKKLMILASLMLLLAMALSFGRAGYVAWAAIGLVLAGIRWKKMIPIGILLALLVIAFVPGVSERMSKGFDEDSRDTDPASTIVSSNTSGEPDLYSILAGRNIAWKYAIQEIREAAFFGYGRQAMIRTGLTRFLKENFGEEFPHPHNAYLQLLLDNGIIGFLLVAPFYWIVVKYSLSLFRDSRNAEYVAIGGVAGALVIAFLVASMSSHSFYPLEESVGRWCAIGLMFRVYVDRERIGRTLSARVNDSVCKSSMPA
jgi:O-antigen ligase